MRVQLKNISIISLSIIAGFLTLSCKNKKDKPTEAPPVKVTVMAVTKSSADSNREYSGTVSSSETTNVSFSVAGTITNLYASEGQKVSKGQLLGKVRDGEYQNALNIANAQLAEAQDGYERLKKLHDANALPEVKWVEMQQKLKQAQNAAEMAQRSVSDAALHSPVSGTVTQKFADVGQSVLPVQPIYEIVSTDNLTIDVSVSENEIGNFKVGEGAYVTFESSEITPMEGKITQKSVVADPITRAYTVKVGIDSDKGKILPGMIGNVKFQTSATDSLENTKPVFVIPSQAVLLNEDNRFFVWIVKDGKAERRFVEADELAEHGITVKSGLEPNDSVIVAGMQKVGTGSKVIAVEQ